MRRSDRPRSPHRGWSRARPRSTGGHRRTTREKRECQSRASFLLAFEGGENFLGEWSIEIRAYHHATLPRPGAARLRRPRERDQSCPGKPGFRDHDLFTTRSAFYELGKVRLGV